MKSLPEENHNQDKQVQPERIVWFPLNPKTWVPLTVGASIGFVIGFSFVVYVYSTFPNGDAAVTERLEKLGPGMSIAEVQQLLGDPRERIEIGEEFDWQGRLAIPSDYSEKHGMLVYVVGVVPMKVLYVFFDEESKVTFVTCHPT